MTNSLPILDQPTAPQAEVATPHFQQALLDYDDLDCVLADLDDFAQLIEILIKGDDGQSQPMATDLVEARNLLVNGQVNALQIVYRFADKVWCDTLIRTPQGAQLLRLEDPARAGG